MTPRWRDFLGTLGVAGALLALVEPRWRMILLRLASFAAPSIGRRYGFVPRSAFLFAAGRLLNPPDAVRGPAAPSLIRLLFDAGARSVGRVLEGRGRWGLRPRRD